ncbi:hypothetical protein NIES4101_67630 [Calothrix sp. NIES-4101]|nr:hypothetical protein NIES4101_67630 [Calothrix sp. NIES-4101]
MSVRLTTVKTQVNSILCGVSVNNLQLPENCFILAIVRNDQLILANQELEIYCGDDLLTVALNSSQITELNYILKQNHPIYYSFDECFLQYQLTHSCNIISPKSGNT